MGNIERSQHMTGREGADHVTVQAWRERDAMHERMKLAEDVADALRQQLQGAVDRIAALEAMLRHTADLHSQRGYGSDAASIRVLLANAGGQ